MHTIYEDSKCFISEKYVEIFYILCFVEDWQAVDKEVMIQVKKEIPKEELINNVGIPWYSSFYNTKYDAVTPKSSYDSRYASIPFVSLKLKLTSLALNYMFSPLSILFMVICGWKRVQLDMISG